MAKLKLSKRPEEKKIDHVRDAKGYVPCLLFVLGGILLVGWIFSAMLKSAK